METESAQPQSQSSHGRRRRSSLWKMVALIVAIIIIVGAGGFVAYKKGLISLGSQEGKTVATVNGTAIHQHDIDIRLNQLKPQYQAAGVNLEDPATLKSAQEQIANEIVNEDLVLEDAKAKGITATDAEVKDAGDQLVAAAGSQDALNAQIKSFGMTQKDYQTTLRNNVIIGKYIDQFAPSSSVSVSEDEITKAYQSLVASQTGTSTPPALADVHDAIEQQLLSQKVQDKILTIVNQLKQNAKVEVLI